MRALVEEHRATIIQFGKFGVIGFLGFFVDYGLFHFARDIFDLNRYVSSLFSFPFAVTFTWFGNRIFTFRGKNEGSIHAQLMRFVSVCAIGLVLNRGTFMLLTATVPIVYKYSIIGLLAGTGAGMFFNFFFSKKLVFK